MEEDGKFLVSGKLVLLAIPSIRCRTPIPVSFPFSFPSQYAFPTSSPPQCECTTSFGLSIWAWAFLVAARRLKNESPSPSAWSIPSSRYRLSIMPPGGAPTHRWINDMDTIHCQDSSLHTPSFFSPLNPHFHFLRLPILPIFHWYCLYFISNLTL